MIAGPRLAGNAVGQFLLRKSLEQHNRFKHGTIAVPRSADVIDLTGSWILHEVPERPDKIKGMDVVADLLSFVSIDGVSGAGYDALAHICEKAVKLSCRMCGAGQ